jgi:hypothetical protein
MPPDRPQARPAWQVEEQKLTNIAQGECAGTAGADMTGQAGNGAKQAQLSALQNERASDERVHDIDLRFREETATVDKEVGIYLSETRKRDRMRSADREERVRNAQGETDGLDDVRALAARWLSEAEGGGAS